MSVDALAEAGRIEPVPPDPETAAGQLAQAREHLASAELLSARDPAGAYVMLYDAARKAVAAHMLAAGWRVRASRPGAHEAVARYAVVALADGCPSARELDRMRRMRNRVEYGAVVELGAADLAADLGHARAIVAAAEAAWPL